MRALYFSHDEPIGSDDRNQIPKKTKEINPFALSGSLLFGLSSVSADTLALAQPEVSGTIDLESDADGNAKKNGVYLRIGAGMNLAMDADVKDISSSFFDGFGFGTDQYTNISIAFDTGFVFDIGVGIPLSGAWSIEIMTGVATNSVESISGNYRDVDSFGSTVPGSLSGGDGDLYQVPIVANIRYEFDLNDETLGLGVYAGAGFQYSDWDLNGGEIIVPGFDPVAIGSGSGDAWAFRYQIGFDLSWEIAANTTLGLNVRYSETSESDFGDDFKVDSSKTSPSAGRCRTRSEPMASGTFNLMLADVTPGRIVQPDLWAPRT